MAGWRGGGKGYGANGGGGGSGGYFVNHAALMNANTSEIHIGGYGGGVAEMIYPGTMVVFGTEGVAVPELMVLH